MEETNIKYDLINSLNELFIDGIGSTLSVFVSVEDNVMPLDEWKVKHNQKIDNIIAKIRTYTIVDGPVRDAEPQPYQPKLTSPFKNSDNETCPGCVESYWKPHPRADHN